MKDAQELVDEYIQGHGGYWDPMSQVLRLVEEVGEFSREINHRYGAKRKKATEEQHSLEDEFGDLLFVVIATANGLKIDLDQALSGAIEKYKTRDKGRWTSESESERQS
jgi:NTP pyrophosphatase (non-canonical NTP hydrolase)